MPDQELHLIRLDIDAARLARLGAAMRLPPAQSDLGFLAHSMLAGLFGEGTLQPFQVLDETARWVPLLAYSARGGVALREHADTYAEPAPHAACDWEGFAAKPVPHLAAGFRLGFDLRACPVVRLAAQLEVTDREGKPRVYRAGHEIDAWVHARFMAHSREEVDRETAYGAWLRDRLGAAAEVESVRLHTFRRLRLVRRDHSSERRAAVLERPEAVLRGTLAVRDAAAFRRLLARGVGRHCAFGFGMLLLRPPRPC